MYRQECGPENPLRCYVGDLSARLGTIDLGLQRKVVVDSNLPLEGPVSAIGRSIVIMSPNKRPERFACANIEPDYNIIKYANIEKPPRFVLYVYSHNNKLLSFVFNLFLKYKLASVSNISIE